MTFFWIPLGLALLDWLGLYRGWVRLEPVTKPAVPAGILAWILLAGPGTGTPAAWFFIGIGFSMVGDILLLPAVDRFLPALGVFLVALLAYTIGLNTVPPPVNFSTVLFAAVVVLLTVRVCRRIAAGLRARGQTGLQAPLLAYSIGMGLALFSALATLANDAWAPVPALLAAGGLVLLAVSDILLGWGRFVAGDGGGGIGVRVSYHLGLILLVGGGLVFGG